MLCLLFNTVFLSSKVYLIKALFDSGIVKVLFTSVIQLHMAKYCYNLALFPRL